ncbi:hypothetical protein NUW54_g3861 [Trametes sanguinea]|uniref:Uncharacterized protein n=1 Tax=Trametes sanguinea TaxID=158606 RepID=A0ACC1PZK4_9APHY|nr:hypothetical protein NUW54_g3861 [Trametes sanguinea]
MSPPLYHGLADVHEEGPVAPSQRSADEQGVSALSTGRPRETPLCRIRSHGPSNRARRRRHGPPPAARMSRVDTRRRLSASRLRERMDIPGIHRRRVASSLVASAPPHAHSTSAQTG